MSFVSCMLFVMTAECQDIQPPLRDEVCKVVGFWWLAMSFFGELHAFCRAQWMSGHPAGQLALRDEVCGLVGYRRSQ